eukprot:COSAG02_NODE_5366_length_4396_cov_69.993548_2_plen_95_part_00
MGAVHVTVQGGHEQHYFVWLFTAHPTWSHVTAARCVQWPENGVSASLGDPESLDSLADRFCWLLGLVLTKKVRIVHGLRILLNVAATYAVLGQW